MRKKLSTNAVEAGLKEMNPAVPNRLISDFENSLYRIKHLRSAVQDRVSMGVNVRLTG